MEVGGRILLVFLMLGVLVLNAQGASADIVNALAAQNCTLLNASQSLTCGDELYAQCDVNDTTSATQVNLVNFQVGTIWYPGALYSGTAKDGQWRALLSVDPLVGNRLEAVRAVNSAGLDCTGSQDVNQPPLVPTGCYIAFTAGTRDYNNTCQCGYTQSTGACSVSNTQVVQNIPVVGCSQLQPFNTTQTCDYCDPLWTPTYSACLSDRTGGTSTQATMTTSFVSGNQSCCLATGLSSDCQPPTNNGQSLVCKEDYWAKNGREEGGAQYRGSTSEISEMLYNSSVLLGATGIVLSTRMPGAATDPVLQPLLFDWDNSGHTGILVQKGHPGVTSKFGVFYENLTGLNQTYLVTLGVGDYWEGQGAVWGYAEFYDQGLRKIFSGGTKNRSVGGGFAAIRYDGGTGHDYFTSWRFENGSFVQKADVDVTGISCTACRFANDSTYLATGRAARSMGVACFLDACYFQTTKNLLVRVNAATGEYQSINLDEYKLQNDVVPGVVDSSGVDVNSVPSLVVVHGAQKAVDDGRGYSSGGFAPVAVVLKRLARTDAASGSANNAVMQTFTIAPNWNVTSGYGLQKDCFDGDAYCVAGTLAEYNQLATSSSMTFTFNGVDYGVTPYVHDNARGVDAFLVNGEDSKNLSLGQCSVFAGGTFVMCPVVFGEANPHFIIALWNNNVQVQLTTTLGSLVKVSNPIASRHLRNAEGNFDVFWANGIGMTMNAMRVGFTQDGGFSGVLNSVGQPKSSAALVGSLTSMDPAIGRCVGTVGPLGVFFGNGLPNGNGTQFSCMEYQDSGNWFLAGLRTYVAAGSFGNTIVAADVNKDAVDEVVTASGIYKVVQFDSSDPLKLFAPTTQNNSAVIVDDVDSNGFLDAVFVNNNSVYLQLSVPQSNAGFVCSNLTVSGMSCTANADGTVSASVPSYCAQYPTWVTWRTTLSKGGTQIAQNAFSSIPVPSGILQSQGFVVSEPGTYTITGDFKDTQTDQVTSASCAVLQTNFQAVAGISNSTSCNYGEDGEFNYDGESVSRHNWIVSTSKEPLIFNGLAQFNDRPELIYHPMVCPSTGWHVEARVMPVIDADAYVKVSAFFDGPPNENFIGGIHLSGTNVSVLTGNGERFVSSAVLENQFHVIAMDFNQQSQTYSLSLDGIALGSFNYNLPSNGFFSEVRVINNGCSSGLCNSQVKFDYVRVSGLSDTFFSGLTTNQSALVAAKSNLAGCVAPSDQNGYDPHNRIGYSHVDGYCTSLNAKQSSSWCSYTQLKDAVRLNANCYQEAYGYCVNVTYPKSAGFSGNDPSQAITQNGLDGAAACNIALSVQTVTDRVVVPFWRVGWNIVTQDIIMVIVIVIIVIIFASTRGK